MKKILKPKGPELKKWMLDPDILSAIPQKAPSPRKIGNLITYKDLEPWENSASGCKQASEAWAEYLLRENDFDVRKSLLTRFGRPQCIGPGKKYKFVHGWAAVLEGTIFCIWHEQEGITYLEVQDCQKEKVASIVVRMANLMIELGIRSKNASANG